MFLHLFLFIWQEKYIIISGKSLTHCYEKYEQNLFLILCDPEAKGSTHFKPLNPFRYPLKTSENQNFSEVSRGYRKRPVAWNGLRSRTKHIQNRRHLEMTELILGITCFFVYVGEFDIKFSRTHNLNMATVSHSK